MGSDRTGLGLVDRRWGEGRNEPVTLPGPKSTGSTAAPSRGVPGVMRRPQRGSANPSRTHRCFWVGSPSIRKFRPLIPFYTRKMCRAGTGALAKMQAGSWPRVGGPESRDPSRGLTSQGREDPWPPS